MHILLPAISLQKRNTKEEQEMNVQSGGEGLETPYDGPMQSSETHIIRPLYICAPTQEYVDTERIALISGPHDSRMFLSIEEIGRYIRLME
jgi:hypothetical protein